MPSHVHVVLLHGPHLSHSCLIPGAQQVQRLIWVDVDHVCLASSVSRAKS